MKKHITPGIALEIARAQLQRLSGTFQAKATVLETLTAFPWQQYSTTSFDQQELSRLNLELDPRTCLGKVALCFAIAEQARTSGAERGYRYGEVREDAFRNILLAQWRNEYSGHAGPPPDGWLKELLMYDEPHGVPVFNGQQFDPLFVVTGNLKMNHPRIVTSPPWFAVASAMTVAQALQESDMSARLDALDAAELLCPNTVLVKENRLLPLVELNYHSDARRIVRELIEIRPTAAIFNLFEALTGSPHPDRSKLYSDRLWSYIQLELNKMEAAYVG
jgi:hypothetical protein